MPWPPRFPADPSSRSARRSPEEEKNLDPFAPQHLSQAENLTGVAVGNLDEAELGVFYADADVIIFPSHYEGFGIPVLHALAAHRPIFVRAMPVFVELWEGLGRNPNIHFYETTAELSDLLRTIPAWIDVAPLPAGNGAARAMRQIREALDTARRRIDYRHIVERIRAVQIISDAGGFHQPTRAAPAPPPLPAPLGALLRLEGREFVRKAYVAALARDADPGGLAHYAERVESGGQADKIEVLRILSSSPEGRKLGTRIPGLQAWVLYYRLRRLPLARLSGSALRRMGLARRPPDPN